MKIVNFGSLNVDYVYRVPHVIVKGETLASTSRNIFSGGKGLNQSVALSRAGLPVYHAGCIGQGGEILLDVLKDSGVNTDFVRNLPDVPVGHTIIQNTDDGDNCIILFGGANQAVSEEQVDETLSHFEEGDWIVLQNEISCLKYIMEKAHERGMKIVLNPSPMNDKISGLPLEYVDYFFVNEIEAGQIIGKSADEKQVKKEDPENQNAGITTENQNTGIIGANQNADITAENTEKLVTGLKKTFPNAHVILTLGSAGSVFIYQQEVLYQQIYKVKAVDTTAAGDTFTGYFLAAVIGGKTPTQALRLASRASSITVSRPGAAPSIPYLQEVEIHENT